LRRRICQRARAFAFAVPCHLHLTPDPAFPTSFLQLSQAAAATAGNDPPVLAPGGPPSTESAVVAVERTRTASSGASGSYVVVQGAGLAPAPQPHAAPLLVPRMVQISALTALCPLPDGTGSAAALQQGQGQGQQRRAVSARPLTPAAGLLTSQPLVLLHDETGG
jgi:hypothetical protein